MRQQHTHQNKNTSSATDSKNQGTASSMPAVPVIQQKETDSFTENDHDVSLVKQEALQNNSVPAIQKKANNTGLPDDLKSGVESLSGMDLSDVKVHYNSSQPAQLNAFAYAQGNNIHVGAGQEKYLPHEAWHVVQQRQGRVQATSQLKKNVAINDDPALENEADVMGAKALQMKREKGHTTSYTSMAYTGVVQRAYTRAMLANDVEKIIKNQAFPGTWGFIDPQYKYMILDRLKDLGVNLQPPEAELLKKADEEAEDNSDIDHIGGGAFELEKGAEGYSDLVQAKRKPGDSKSKTFTTTGGSPYKDVVYNRDDPNANVTFDSPKSHHTWSNPVHGAPIDLEDGCKKHYGMMLSEKIVKISDASRDQHFSIANRVAKKKGQTAGEGGNSPDGYTWHHLLDKYKMVLVDRKVHQQFGHNGGFYFW